MIDYGFTAALKTALRFFAHSSRGTGRTSAMLEACQPGDLIITTNDRERRRLFDELRRMGKEEVGVRSFDPYEMDLLEIVERLRPNKTGATIFDHEFVERYAARTIEGIFPQLAAAAGHLSTRPAPEFHPGAMGERFIDFEKSVRI